MLAYIGCVPLNPVWTSTRGTLKIEYYNPYSGKFSYGGNFRVFRMLHPLYYENKNYENLNVRFFPFASDL